MVPCVASLGGLAAVARLSPYRSTDGLQFWDRVAPHGDTRPSHGSCWSSSSTGSRHGDRGALEMIWPPLRAGRRREVTPVQFHTHCGSPGLFQYRYISAPEFVKRVCTAWRCMVLRRIYRRICGLDDTRSGESLAESRPMQFLLAFLQCRST